MSQTGCPFDFNDDQILSNQDRNRAVMVEYIVQKCKPFNYFLSSATTWKIDPYLTEAYYKTRVGICISLHFYG